MYKEDQTQNYDPGRTSSSHVRWTMWRKNSKNCV